MLSMRSQGQNKVHKKAISNVPISSPLLPIVGWNGGLGSRQTDCLLTHFGTAGWNECIDSAVDYLSVFWFLKHHRTSSDCHLCKKKKRSYSWLSNNSIAASWACSVKVESTFTASASLLFWLCWLDPPVLSGSAHQTCNCVSLPLCLSFSQWFMCLSVYVPELFFIFKFSSTTPVTPVLTLPHVSDVDLIRAEQQVKLWQ